MGLWASSGSLGLLLSNDDSGVLVTKVMTRATCILLVHHLEHVASSSPGQEERGQGELMALKYLLARTSHMPLAPTIKRLENLGEHMDIW